MIKPGKKLDTRFQLKVFRDGTESVVTFAELLTRPTIVSVYMRNNTPGCDRQNDSLAAHAAEFDRAGYNLVALSRDTCGSHAKYAAKKKISYTLASDPDDLFAKAADAVVEKSMYGRTYTGPARGLCAGPRWHGAGGGGEGRHRGPRRAITDTAGRVEVIFCPAGLR